MKTIGGLLVGILIAGIFLFAIYKFLPLGVAIAIIGGCLNTLYWTSNNKITKYLGGAGGFIYFGGVIYSFIQHGLLEGFAAIIVGFLAYHYARKQK